MECVEISIDGKTYEADYVLNENVVTVYGEGGSESTQLGGLNEEQVARILLRNLIRKGYVLPTEELGQK